MKLVKQITTLVMTVAMATTGVSVRAAPREQKSVELKGVVQQQPVEVLKVPVQRRRVLKGANKNCGIGKYKKYRLSYYYNKLNATEKKWYDDLDAICLQFLQGTENGYYETTYKCNYLPKCVESSIAEERIIELVEIFRFENPQYYFLNGRGGIGKSGKKVYYYAGVYSKFMDGVERAECTKELFRRIDILSNQVTKKCKRFSLMKKLLFIHNYIIYNCDYDIDRLQYLDTNHNEEEDQLCTQSVWPLLNERKGLCGSFAALYQLLCITNGIQAITVSGSNHAWNKVLVSGKWKNVDLSYDDVYTQENPKVLNKTYFLKTDSQMNSIDKKAGISQAHVRYRHWAPFKVAG